MWKICLNLNHLLTIKIEEKQRFKIYYPKEGNKDHFPEGLAQGGQDRLFQAQHTKSWYK